MSNLRSLTNQISISSPTIANWPTEIIVTGNHTVCGSGCCCAFVAPAGTTWITFELWGGGGGGAVSCCCMYGNGGGAGGYTIKSITGSFGGCTYTVCAAATAAPSQSVNGNAGSTSWVTGQGLSNLCAVGGQAACSQCNWWQAYYQCGISTCCSPGCGGDFNAFGYCGESFHAIYCAAQGTSGTPMAPATASGPILGPNGCQWGGCTAWGAPYFPGGGGHSAVASANSCCFGAWGGAGMVSITYG